jgi:hypothetical protein
MNDAERVGGGCCAEVALIYDRYGEPTQSGIPGGTRSVNAGSDDQKVEPRLSQTSEIAAHCQGSETA